ncbi:MAG: aldo/keto reductase [Bifidobacteriaceae bacterium]|jgi:aryl-alcohol dehydrogenase-like predicted oxidoreductase|nr:aldo/keto reductase [Bifidobacteriaceae bacterium]
MKTRQIGPFTVSAIGLGGMPMSIEGRPDRARSIATIHAALDAGVRHIDTAFAYRVPLDAEQHNELLIAEALRSWPGDVSEVLVATKGGHFRHPYSGADWPLAGQPAWLKTCAKESVRALGVEAISLYYYHRPDPRVPYADSIGALADLLAEGVIVKAGISNANPEQIKLALSILGEDLVAVQNQFSPAFRSSEPELELCAELGIAFLPWSPLGGIANAGGLADRFAAFGEVARDHGVSPQQVALAWELAKGDHVIPIPGSSRPETILDSLAAADLELTPEELALLG